MITETFVSLFLVWFIWYAISTYTKRRSMPPGPIPFPFVGNIPQMTLADPVNPFSDLAKKYGDIFTVTFPNGDLVVLNTATLVREARAAGKQEDLAGKLPESIYPFSAMVGVNLFAGDYSPVYRFRKRVFVSAMHVFGAGKEQATTRAGYAVDVAIEEIETEPGRPFSPKKLFNSSIIVQLWEWLTSKKVPLDDPVVKNINEFGHLVTKQPLFNTMFRFLGSLPTQLSRDIKRAQEIRNMTFPPEYRAHHESYTPGVVRDLTDSFISAYEKEIAKESEKDIGSKDDIPGLMLDVVAAGSDTTSSLLTWFFLYMVLHPDVQKKIHEDLDDVVGRDRVPSWDDEPNLPYLQAALCEAQRASGMVTLVGTNAIRGTTIAGYHIPKDTFVALNLSQVHHDEREWPEADIFKPDRFLDSDGNFVGWNKLHGFLPFSVGRRDCPGQSLAKIMMFSFASVLLHRYKIELPDGAESPTDRASNFQILTKPNDFLVVAKPRV